MKITKYFLVGILIFCIPLFIYALYFRGASISDNPSDWGAFGDYLGGVLNPLLSIINIIIFIYLTQLVSKFEDKRTQQSLEYQKKITLNEFRQQECKELAMTLNVVLEELPRYETALENAMIALYKVKTCNDRIMYLFPILKEEENIKLINDLTEKLNKIIEFFSVLKKNLTNKDNVHKLLTEFNTRDELEPMMTDYLTLKTKLIQVLQKYILDDLEG